jgi:hypothetical protein
LAWYSDRHGIFVRNGKEPWTLSGELAGRREPTQVARALEELGVNLILARTPQAKGRVERCWGTLQDRLVKELWRANACTWRKPTKHSGATCRNSTSALPGRQSDPKPAFLRLPRGTDLDAICSFHYTRTVANDNTVRLEERLVHVSPGPGSRSYARCRVQVQERLDGSLAVFHQSHRIAYQPAVSDAPLRARQRRTHRDLEPEPRQLPLPAPKPTKTVSTNDHAAFRKPPPDHPWRRSPRYPVTNSQAS